MEKTLNLTFLAHDDEGNMRLLKCTTESAAPDVDQEWSKLYGLWKEKAPLLGSLNLVGALEITPDQRVRWYPDVDDVLTAEMVGRTLH